MADVQNLNIHDLVQLEDDKLPSWQWPLGRIADLKIGGDEKVRIATYKKVCLFHRY